MSQKFLTYWQIFFELVKKLKKKSANVVRKWSYQEVLF